jgi:preprotein translocase subunit SecG
MKKVTYLFAALFIAAIIVTSCNKKECPAYSQADTEATEQTI